MEKALTAREIGLALKAAGLDPMVASIDYYHISLDGERYMVFTGNLPDVYIRKMVPAEQFEFLEKPWILASALNAVNGQFSPVSVASLDENLVFILCIEPASYESLVASLPRRLEQLEHAVDRFAHVCDVFVRDEQQDEFDEVTSQLTNPTPDSPWLQGQKAA